MEPGVLQARIHSLDQSRRGYLSAFSRVCNQIEDLFIDGLIDEGNVDILRSRLESAWDRYENCCGVYFATLDENCGKIEEVKSQYCTQRVRKL